MQGSKRGSSDAVPVAGMLERAREGDPNAWSNLYESVTGRLLVWLRARPMGDPSLSAEDIVADTWLIAAERIHDFSGDESDFAGWLFGIARNLMNNAQRRASRRSTSPTDFSETDICGTTEGHEAAYAASDWVRQTLSTLPPREAEVLTCTEVVGLDTAATALALEISPTAVRVARHRGLARLRNQAEIDQQTGPNFGQDFGPDLGGLIGPRLPIQPASAIAASATR